MMRMRTTFPLQNVLRQALSLIATMPLTSVYAYHAYQHYHNDQSLVIRYPDPELSTAENILRILRSDGQYTELEAQGTRYGARHSRGARRRKQLDLYDSRRFLYGYRYVLCGRRFARFSERTAARRCKPEGREHVAGHQGTCAGLGERG